MKTTFAARTLITATEIVDRPLITVEDGRIAAIASRNTTEAPAGTQDLGDATLTSGFLDIHIHGAASHDVMEGTPEALHAVSSFLATRGVAQYLPTTVTAGIEPTLQGLDGIANAIEAGSKDGAATAVGIHLEGPFVSHGKRGIHPPEHIVEPSVELFDRFWQAARGHIRLMTIAPELPHALEVIRHASKLGVRLSLGHSGATAAQTLAAIDAGATSATHTYNAMRPLDHREPGILGTVLDRDDLFAELICDGIHVAPPLVRLWLKAKTAQRGMLITDGMSATGMPNGTYMLGGIPVTVADGKASNDGVLAGSVLTLDRAVENVLAFTDCSLAEATRMASITPAEMLGLPTPLTLGAPASFNVFSSEGKRTAFILRGKILSA